MDDIGFVTVNNGDIELQVAVQGEGPLILCVHGWPELWYSWRHQMAHFAPQGYTVAAMNVRGYGDSSNPTEVAAYSLTNLASDAVAVIDALGDGSAILFGHDWGAPIVWNTARLHPDKVSAVAGLSVPYMPVGPTSSLELWQQMYADNGKFFYQLYFLNNPGGAEAELGADSTRSVRMIYYSGAGESAGAGLIAEKPADAKMLDGLIDPDPFPAWATPEDLAVYGDAFDRSGWHGPLNRYRAQTIDADELGSLPNPELHMPTAFIGGEHDPVRRFVPGVDVFAMADGHCTDFRGATIVDGAGHWIQQEAPQATNVALQAFVDSL